MNMRPAFHTIIPLTFAAISAGCASERNLVSDGEMWWSETFGASAHDASVAEADRIWSGNKTMQRTADDWSVVRAEDRANAAMEPVANDLSVAAADRKLTENKGWQELVKRFSVAQAEQDFVKDAKR